MCKTVYLRRWCIKCGGLASYDQDHRDCKAKGKPECKIEIESYDTSVPPDNCDKCEKERIKKKEEEAKKAGK
ncbi:hypothetical protein NW762_008206 [Fusarium torreyae]|uniref:Uncharacterized protein n=1 Tax=Fusarium torreyae TaxID=1237075 RepID=A0A9W8VDG6_9HYPO|nr:hypothetical protein NW762_008206 [Fusarium torreyae]